MDEQSFVGGLLIFLIQLFFVWKVAVPCAEATNLFTPACTVLSTVVFAHKNWELATVSALSIEFINRNTPRLSSPFKAVLHVDTWLYSQSYQQPDYYFSTFIENNECLQGRGEEFDTSGAMIMIWNVNKSNNLCLRSIPGRGFEKV